MNLLTHTFKNSPVRIVDQQGNPWFVAADVCRILGINNPSKALSELDSDERSKVDRMTLTNSKGQNGGAQSFNIVSESGLYALIFKSRKAEAKTFRKWVTSEVLPAIRRTGKYDSGTDSMTAAIQKFVEANFKGRLASKIVAKLKPRGEYGEIAKNGQPKTGFRSPCWVAQRSRQKDAAHLMGLILQLELFTESQPLIQSK